MQEEEELCSESINSSSSCITSALSAPPRLNNFSYWSIFGTAGRRNARRSRV